MHTLCRVLLPVLLGLVCSHASAALTLDDFEEGPFVVAYDSATGGAQPAKSEQSGLDPTHTVGGVRLVVVRNFSGLFAPAQASAALAAPLSAVDDGVLLAGTDDWHAWLFYDGTAGGATTGGSTGTLGLNLSPYAEVTVEATALSGETPTLELRIWDGVGFETVSRDLVTGANRFDLGEFTSVNLGDVRTLGVRVASDTAAGVTITGISAAQAAIRYVNPSDPTCGGASPCHGTIQEAVDAADPDSVVRLMAGKYDETVSVLGRANLVIEGDPAAAPEDVRVAPSASVPELGCIHGAGAIEIGGSAGITIRNFTVEGYGGFGVRLRGGPESSQATKLLGLRVLGNGQGLCGGGIAVEAGSSDVLLAHSVIHANAGSGIVFPSLPAGGAEQAPFVWSNSILGNARHGVLVSGFERPDLVNNVIIGNGTDSDPLPAYGVARDLSGAAVLVTSSEMILSHNLICGNASGELLLAPTESPDATGNLTPTGSEGAGFAPSPGCGQAAQVFADHDGLDDLSGTLDDDFFLKATSPAIDAGAASPPSHPALADLQRDFARASVRPADGDDDGGLGYDIGALEYGVAPTISISSPSDGALAASYLSEVTGTYSGTQPLELEILGAPATPSGGSSFTQPTTLEEGPNSLTVSIENAFGAASDTVTVTLPELAVGILDPSDGESATSSEITVSGTVNDTAASVHVDGLPAVVSGSSFSAPITLSDETTVLTATASRSDDTAVDQVTVVLPPLAIEILDPADHHVASSGEIVISGTVNDEAASVSVNGVSASRVGSAFSASVPLAPLTNIVVATATRNDDSAEDQATVLRVVEAPPSPAPPAADAATELSASTLSDFESSISFLYEGDGAVQSFPDDDSSVIDAYRAAVATGRITTRSGDPIGGVRVSALHADELGETYTQADGSFHFVVNGGRPYTLDFRHPAYIPAQRRLDVPWNDFSILEEIHLVPFDPVATTIEMGSSIPIQVARGTVSSDEDGVRQATALFSAGTEADIGDTRIPSGSSIDVRLTEFTVGEAGARSMPAALSPTSAYTYAVEASVDEAVAMNESTVTFTKPVVLYVENFLDMPEGEIVPFGSYDTKLGRWVSEENGIVVRIASIEDGKAVVSPPGVVTSDAEREVLANLYTVGQELWRAETAHFTPMDENWPPGFPADARETSSDGVQQNTPLNGDPSATCGSVIECETQVLGEIIDLVGSPFSLHYRSDRVPGHEASRTIRIPITDDDPPGSLTRVDVVVDVAGQRSEFSFPPDPNQPLFEFTWDGLDAFGRAVSGTKRGDVRIGYVYQATYQEPSDVGQSFEEPSATRVEIRWGRKEAIAWRDFETRFGALDARGFGIAGWTLSPHHFYDPDGRILYRGDGRTRRALGLNRVIRHVAGSGYDCCTEIGIPGPAEDATFQAGDLAVSPDGTVYLTGDRAASNNRVMKIGRDGIIDFVTAPCGGTYGSNDGDPVSETCIGSPVSIAAGPDASVYVRNDKGLAGDVRIRRIDPDGIVSTIAGTGESDCTIENLDSTDGELATSVSLCRGSAQIASGPDGSVYFATATGEKRLRRVRPDGILETILGAGSGPLESSSGVSAAEWGGTFRGPFAIDLNGVIYFAAMGADLQSDDVYAIRPEDRVVTRAAGGGNPPDGLGDGGAPTAGRFDRIKDLAIGPDGGVYVATTRNGGPSGTVSRIRYFRPGATLRTIAGNGSYGLGGSGSAAAQAPLGEPTAIAFSPDGTLYVADRQTIVPYLNQIRAIAPTFPARGADEVTIASESGTELYGFDESGRHLWTRDAITGAELLTFQYDSRGQLVSIRQLSPTGISENDLVTLIERDGNGDPTALVGPYGDRTDLAVDQNGFLAAAVDPLNQSHTMASSAEGLLATFTRPKGGEHVFTYDELGLLQSDVDPLGGSKSLTRLEDGDAIDVTIETALGRQTSKRLVPAIFDAAERRELEDSAGFLTILEEATGETVFAELPDGTQVDVTLGPDPRLGLEAPIATSHSVSTPGLLERVTTQTRSATVDPTGALLSQVDVIDLNGRTAEISYDAATLEYAFESFEGRMIYESIDEQGRIVRSEVDGLEPVRVTYDDLGRAEVISQGQGAAERAAAMEYDGKGRVESVTDPIGRVSTFVYDDAGRVTEGHLPGGRVVRYGYDANGNLQSLQPPGQPWHVFLHTLLDQEAEYSPPAIAPQDPRTLYAYDKDRSLLSVSRPDGTTITFDYPDATGRLASMTTDRGTTFVDYDPGTGRISGLTAPGGEELSYSYDGFLPTAQEWSGTIDGAVAHAYDDDFRVEQQTVTDALGSQSVSFGYDGDSLLTQAGALSITRASDTGLILATGIGGVATSVAYNEFGESVGETATIGGNPVYQTSLSRDALGRVTQKVETIQGTTATTDYLYDSAGRLEHVYIDSVLQRTYSYDDNGNRLSVIDAGAGSTSGSYDDQDRLVTYGARTYTHDLAGDLLSHQDTGTLATTAFSYDAVGNLVQVALPGGPTIGYVIDGQNRRIGKRVGGVLERAWLYQDQPNPVAELDAAGNLVARFVYGTRANVPDYMVKGGSTYRILSDHIGSVRLVVDASTGTVAQRIDYDEFGNITQDTNPGFQPFGFAGGIYDPDTGLTRFGARDYEPVVGRWTTKDPIRFDGGFNLYGYVLNDPVNLIDVDGLIPKGTDKRYGLPDRFWNWYHRNQKQPGAPDLGPQDAHDLYDDWLAQGQPGADAKDPRGKGKKGGRGKWRGRGVGIGCLTTAHCACMQDPQLCDALLGYDPYADQRDDSDCP